MLEYSIDLTTPEHNLGIGLTSHQGAVFHMLTWTFATAPTSGTFEFFVDRGDSIFIPISQTSADKVFTPGNKILYAGPLETLKVVFTGVVGGSGAVLRLWSFDQCPTLGAPEGVYTGLRAITSQTYTEANVKKGSQFEASSYNSAFLGVSNTVVITGDLPATLKGRAVIFDGMGVKLETFVNPVFTGGTPTPIYNLNYKNPELPTLTLLALPTVTSDGTKVSADKVMLGSIPQGGSSVTASTMFNEAEGLEFALAANSIYLFKATSLDPAAQRVSSYSTWYEGDTDLP